MTNIDSKLFVSSQAIKLVLEEFFVRCEKDHKILYPLEETFLHSKKKNLKVNILLNFPADLLDSFINSSERFIRSDLFPEK